MVHRLTKFTYRCSGYNITNSIFNNCLSNNIKSLQHRPACGMELNEFT